MAGYSLLSVRTALGKGLRRLRGDEGIASGRLAAAFVDEFGMAGIEFMQGIRDALGRDVTKGKRHGGGRR